jgi:hypothetical protein
MNMEGLIAGALISIGAALWLIVADMPKIRDALNKIAQNATEEIRISVPNNKSVRVDLPDGGTISGPIGREGRQ